MEPRERRRAHLPVASRRPDQRVHLLHEPSARGDQGVCASGRSRPEPRPPRLQGGADDRRFQARQRAEGAVLHRHVGDCDHGLPRHQELRACTSYLRGEPPGVRS